MKRSSPSFSPPETLRGFIDGAPADAEEDVEG